MRTCVVFFWETMVKGEQLLQQRGRGRQKGSVDACKHLYIQHTSTDAHTVQHNSGHSSCSGKWNKDSQSSSLWLLSKLYLASFELRSVVALWRCRSLSSYDKPILWHGEYSCSEVMSRHSTTVKREHLKNLSLGCVALNPHGSKPTPTHMSTQADIYTYSTCHICTLQTCNHVTDVHIHCSSSSIKPGDFPFTYHIYHALLNGPLWKKSTVRVLWLWTQMLVSWFLSTYV